MIHTVKISFPFVMSAADYHAFAQATSVLGNLAKVKVRHEEFVVDTECDYIADLAWDGHHQAHYFAVIYTTQTPDEVKAVIQEFLTPE